MAPNHGHKEVFELSSFYLTYAGYEIRKWLRDPFSRFIITYPVVLAAIIRFAIPFAEKQAGRSFAPFYHVILASLALIIPRISGAIVAFSILDDRDDNVLFAVKVAPLTFDFFIGLKMFVVFVFSFLGAMFAVWFAGLASVSLPVLIEISFLSAFGAPLIALLINCFASNKVEGFAGIKGFNGLVVVPIVSLFFFDKKEFLFAFEPGFWPGKAFSSALINPDIFQLSYSQYYLIGLVYAVTLNVVVYQAFKRKIDS